MKPRTPYLYLVSAIGYGGSNKKTENTFSNSRYIWPENEPVILDDGNVVATKTILVVLLQSGRLSASFSSYEKNELQMRKASAIFHPFSARKTEYEKKIDVISGYNVAYKLLVQFTKPRTLYSVSVLRYRGSIMKNSQKFRSTSCDYNTMAKITICLTSQPRRRFQRKYL